MKVSLLNSLLQAVVIVSTREYCDYQDVKLQSETDGRQKEELPLQTAKWKVVG